MISKEFEQFMKEHNIKPIEPPRSVYIDEDGHSRDDGANMPDNDDDDTEVDE